MPPDANQDAFHTDILTCVPKGIYDVTPGLTSIKLTHKNTLSNLIPEGRTSIHPLRMLCV